MLSCPLHVPDVRPRVFHALPLEDAITDASIRWEMVDSALSNLSAMPLGIDHSLKVLLVDGLKIQGLLL